MVNGKKEILKPPCLALNKEILLLCLAICTCRAVGIKSKMHLRDFEKETKFLIPVWLL